MEKYACNLELAKKLKELGVKQESEFYWIVNKMKGVPNRIISKKDKRDEYDYKDFSQHYYSAFTVGESGEILKDKTLGQIYVNGKWGWQFMNKAVDVDIFADTEANARAKMRIYLIENKLIEANP